MTFMKTTLKIGYLIVASVFALSGVAEAQALRIEAESGAVGLLQVAQQDYAKAKQLDFVASLGTNSAAGALGKLCRGEVQVAATARVITKTERDACAQNKVQLIELPVAVDAIAIVANPRNTWVKQVSVPELRRAWLEAPGKASSWKQLNGSWPETALKLYGPTPKLGLSESYRAVLAPGAKEGLPAIRSDISATEELAVVVDGVARDQGALGVLDWATYSANAKRVRLVAVEIDGKAVLPGVQTLRDRSYAAFSYPVMLYVNANNLQDAAVRGFLEHVLVNGERLAGEAGLAPLAATDYRQARQRLGAAR
jgi:phosphate transport system substrate-binding protein